MCVKEVKPTKPPYEVGFYKFLCDGFYQTHSSKPNTIIGFHIHPFIPKPFNHTHLQYIHLFSGELCSQEKKLIFFLFRWNTG